MSKPPRRRPDPWVRVLGRVCFVGLLGVIVLTVVVYGTVDAWWEGVFETAVFMLTAVWLLEGFLSGTWQLRRLSVLLPLALLTAYAFVQTVSVPSSMSGGRLIHAITIDRYQTLLTTRKMLAFTLFFGLLLLHTTTPSRLRWLVRLLIGLGVASALFGVIRELLQPPDSTTGFGLPFLFYGMGYGEFISANAFAYLMEMTYGLLTGVALGGGVRGTRIILYFAPIIVVWAALVLCNSRGGIVGFACQSVFLLFFTLSWYSARRLLNQQQAGDRLLLFIRTSRLVRAAAVLLVVGTLIAGVLWMGGDQLASKIELAANNQASLDGTTRKEIWHSTWQLVKQRPLTGVGFGAYFLAIPEYQMGSGSVRLEEAHNDYLDLVANGGLIAVGLSAWFVLMVVWRGNQAFSSNDKYRRAAALGSAAGALGVAVHSVVDFGLQLTGIAVVFAALVVVLISDKRVESLTPQTK